MKEYLPETASQTAGPYVHIGLAPDAAGFHIFEKILARSSLPPIPPGSASPLKAGSSTAPGRRSAMCCWRSGRPTPRVAITILTIVNSRKPSTRPSAAGGVPCSDFTSGIWRFETIKPGPVVGRDGRLMAPHVNLWVVARGINIGLNTRMYFADEHAANASDPVLNLIEWEVRRKTLIAEREVRGTEVVYRFDIHLQGENETVFFDI